MRRRMRCAVFRSHDLGNNHGTFEGAHTDIVSDVFSNGYLNDADYCTGLTSHVFVHILKPVKKGLLLDAFMPQLAVTSYCALIEADILIHASKRKKKNT